jgi:hypothetical protein
MAATAIGQQYFRIAGMSKAAAVDLSGVTISILIVGAVVLIALAIVYIGLARKRSE